MRRTLGYKVNILLFLLPALFLFVAVLIAPIAMSAYYSFMNWNGLKTPEFIGFKNYVELFTSNSISFVRPCCWRLSQPSSSCLSRCGWH